MTFDRSRRERLHVVELLLQEGVPLLQRVVLLQRQRVDRPHEPQLPLELTRPRGRRGALGHLRRLGRHGDLGLHLEVAAEGLHRGLQAQLDLGLVELGATGLLAGLLEATLGVGALVAQLVESGGGGPLRLALLPAPLAQLPELALDGGQPIGDQGRELVDRALLGVELDPTDLGLAAGLHRPVEPSLHLGEPGAQELPAVGEARRAHLEIGSERAHRRRPLLEVGLRGGHGLGLLGRVGLLRLEEREGELELVHPSLLAGQPLPQLGGVGHQRLGLGGGVATVGIDALQARRWPR